MATRHLPRCLPEWIRDKGIATQKELVMALLPYLQWHPKQKLMTSFLTILPHAETSPKKSFVLDRQILELMKKGLIERKYVGDPQLPVSPENKLHNYVYYRRISRSVPHTKNNKARKALLAGTYAIETKKSSKSKPAPKNTNANLTMMDVELIRCDPYGMSTRQMSEMFNICQSAAWRIKRGAYPQHLKNYFKEHYS